jgi:hypothetical protein
MRMRVSDLDLGDPATASQFERSCEKMASILAKKKIPEAKAKRAIAETLEVAADHQLQSLRRNDSQRDRMRSVGDVGRLVARLEELAQALAKLPPVSKKKLNAIVAEYTAQFFDTETFSSFVCALADALPKLAPKRRARVAVDVIDRPIAGVIRTSPPRTYRAMGDNGGRDEASGRASSPKLHGEKISHQILAATRRVVKQVFAAGKTRTYADDPTTLHRTSQQNLASARIEDWICI